MEKKKTICPLDCPDACGMIATLEDGALFPGGCWGLAVKLFYLICTGWEGTVKNGDRVKLFNDRGSNIRVVRVTDKTQPKLLVAEGIYWAGEASNQTGVNDLTSHAVTDLGEGGTFHESRVGISKYSHSKL